MYGVAESSARWLHNIATRVPLPGQARSVTLRNEISRALLSRSAQHPQLPPSFPHPSRRSLPPLSSCTTTASGRASPSGSRASWTRLHGRSSASPSACACCAVVIWATATTRCVRLHWLGRHSTARVGQGSFPMLLPTGTRVPRCSSWSSQRPRPPQVHRSQQQGLCHSVASISLHLAQPRRCHQLPSEQRGLHRPPLSLWYRRPP